MFNGISKEKAQEILDRGEVKGKPLSDKQIYWFKKIARGDSN